MVTRAWGVAGLLAGVAAGLAALALVAYVPDQQLASLPDASTMPAARTSASPSLAAPPAATGTVTIAAPPAIPTSSANPLLHVGRRAPVLALQLAGGGFTDLAERRGRPVWVVFVTTSCATCAEQVGLLNGFLARYATIGLQVLAVDVAEDATTVGAWARRTGATFPVLLDLDGGAAKAWEVAAYPSHFWIDAAGVVRDAVQGAATADLMAHGLAQVLPGVQAAPSGG